ncbi:glycoside hydrolase family 88 protein [Paenibacillus paeoniae]|uniref:Glucuronyl hydrolase n=1 Tax=Paenibacillus paeoniae TaxID=2292705 RepID=A0A371P826_9BACL|nr:glycoside hydrolase family 88 protein [Paenibacillus paeoniae]REK71688.1 glucuronyl hydrolase [Paenibacillus paeoniae]
MRKQAIEDAMKRIKRNINSFNGKFPHVGHHGSYERIENEDWTNGFWPGMLWLCYEYSGDRVYADAARKVTESFQRRLDSNTVLDHHDIGFLYSLSAKAEWFVTGNEDARALALRAADKLLERWREAGQYIQAWGPAGDEAQGGRIIIDCLLNLPLLFWAANETGEERFRRVALKQAEQSRRYLVRGDDSSYHTFIFNQHNGEPIGGTTHQGYSNGSTWTRGQAWGVYGFALAYRYTGDQAYLDTSKRMALYFIRHLPEDHVAYWDFNAPAGPDTYRDSSASAIVASGLQELLEHLPAADPDADELREGLMASVHSLIEHYSTMDDFAAEGLLKHGSYYVRGNLAPDDFTIWGDYYYLEALMRLERGIRGYWYAPQSDQGGQG